MSLSSLLAVLEPGLGRRDHQFFELAATLIPIFFLAGTIAGATETSRPQATPRHMGFAFVLLIFVFFEIFAELVSIESLVSGVASGWDRYLALGALVLGMWAAGFALLWPWVERFLASRSSRQAALMIVVVVGLGVGSSAIGVFSVFRLIFDVTQEERDFHRIQKEQARRHRQRQELQPVFRAPNDILRLEIRLARVCRSGPRGGWSLDERLSLTLVKRELREYVDNHHLQDAVDLSKKSRAARPEGWC